jgi:hypothetical protein
MSHDLEADYVIVGAGAAGLAFADTLLSETEATMVIVDRRYRPGGHWNDAYPFVRLHAPSTLYGVNSRALGTGRIDQIGLNEGLLELASGAEVLAYYEQLMCEHLLPSGRVTYLPMQDYRQEGEITSRLDGHRRRLRARRRLVDGTYADTRVPATHAPTFEVSGAASCVTPTELAALERAAKGFVIIGGGKTAIDTTIWLLEQGIDPDSILWIRPRDAWLLDRANFQTDAASFERTIGSFALELEVACTATSTADLFARLEAHGLLHRIDPRVAPTMYRCATVSAAELAQLRRIKRVVRLGHVRAIRPDRIVLEEGVIPTSPDFVHIHCAADGIPRKPPQPIFQSGRIVLQYVRRCSPAFSAALIACVEAAFQDDDVKNRLCGVVPVPDEPLDWLRMLLQDAQNASRWRHSAPLRRWLTGSRLNRLSNMMDAARQSPSPGHRTVLERYGRAVGPALARLSELLAQTAQAPRRDQRDDLVAQRA